MARPTIYTLEMVEKAGEYLSGGYEVDGSVIPSTAGLAEYLGIARSTLYLWGEDEEKPEFSDILQSIQSKQERLLLNSGLKGDFNSAITKLVLGKHGYHDKQDNTHANPDGSAMTLNFIGASSGPATTS